MQNVDYHNEKEIFNYWHRVTDDSMKSPVEPSIPKGWLVHATPLEHSLKSGNFVIAKNTNNNAILLRQYIEEEKPYLKALNPEYSDLTSDFEVLGKVTYAGFEV